MKLEAIGKPFTYRWPDGEVHFVLGTPVELSAERAAKLLAKAADRVRVVDTQSVIIEPAEKNARSIYWEATNGTILGPAVPEWLAKADDEFWVVTTFEGQTRWVRSDLLRSQKAFQEQWEVHSL